MAAKNIVPKSINFPGADRCVDIFRRPEGAFGFEEFRRDVEAGRGWFPIGFFGNRVFVSEAVALSAARSKVAWLNDALKGG